MRARARGLNRTGEIERDRARCAAARVAGEGAADKSAAPADRLGNDPDRPVALGDDVAGLLDIHVAADVADALQQHAVRADAGGLDRAGEVEVERPGVAGTAGIAEVAVDQAAAAAQALRDDSDRAIASGHNIALLGIVDIAAVAVADGLQQRAVGAVAQCVDRAGEVERDRSRVAGAAGIAEAPSINPPPPPSVWTMMPMALSPPVSTLPDWA